MTDEEPYSPHQTSRIELLYELEQLWTYLEHPDVREAFREAMQLRRARERRRLQLVEDCPGDVLVDKL